MQGDRRAGPSLKDYNFESIWGQRALKATYRSILEEKPKDGGEEGPSVTPPACLPTPDGHAPEVLIPTCILLSDTCTVLSYQHTPRLLRAVVAPAAEAPDLG